MYVQTYKGRNKCMSFSLEISLYTNLSTKHLKNIYKPLKNCKISKI